MPVRHSCHWFQQPVGLIKKADVVIIGGGFAGISLLYNLCTLQPDLDVILLEESFPGYHTSGRTLGCVKNCDPEFIRKLKNYLPYYNFVANGNKNLAKIINSEHLQCNLRHNGGIYLATTLTEVGHVRKFHETIHRDNFLQMMSESELKSLLGTQRFKQGVFTPQSSTLDPYLLIKELSEVIEQTGRRIICNAKVDKVVNRSSEIVVHVRNRGKIVAKNVVYCTGAYTSEFVPLTDYVKSCKQHYFATKAIPDNVVGKLPTMTLYHRDKVLRLDGNTLLSAGQIDDTGSLDDGEVEQKDFDRLRHSVNSIYPGITKRFGIDCIWSAVACVGTDGLPIVGPVPRLRGHFLNIGHGFNGFGSSVGAADILAEYLLSGDSKHAVAELISPHRFKKES